jgi:hypothetical protein
MATTPRNVPRTCTICLHEQRADIDAALLAEEPYRSIAKRYGASASAVLRHRDHIPAHLAKAKDAEEMTQADTLLEQVRNLQTRALDILDRADEAGDLRTALGAIREARSNLELLAKLLGELQQEGTINVTVTPEWMTLRATVITALHPYPDAAQAVSRALTAGER